MAKPNSLIMSGYGINCEDETKFAFEKAGANSDIVHINDLIDSYKKLKAYQIIALPGGFSFGDDTDAGNAYANKVRDNLWDQIKEFVEKDKLVIGICNGFQILVNLGLAPALKKQYGAQQVALVHNDSARYNDRWVDLYVENDTPWLQGIDEISLPIAHGEGKFYAPDNILCEINMKGLVAVKYINGDYCKETGMPANPNDSIDDIAGITDETGRILGMMPHPERAIDFTQLPLWTLQKEQLKRQGKDIPTEADGLKVFKNAVNYFK